MKKKHSEAKSFIHERIIYEYMKHRTNYTELKMRHIVKLGKFNSKKEYVKVMSIQIDDTRFPDVNKIVIRDTISRQTSRVAEIKFLTSEFNYHKEKRFKEFQSKNGCIIVLRHDFLPKNLDNIDVYQLDRKDFESFVRENFDRLLSHQLLSRDTDEYKIWLFSQTQNFYATKRNNITEPAYKTGIWCPTHSMTEFDLAKNDKVIFIKFGGSPRLKQEVNKYFKKGEIFPNWFIFQLWIGEIILPIKDRYEYCQLKNYNVSKPLWHSEVTKKNFYPRVFEFKEINVINCNIQCKELYLEFNKLVYPILYEVLFQQVTREISYQDYIKLLEFIAKKQAEQLPFTIKGYDKSKVKKLLDEAITTPHMLKEIQNYLNKLEQNILH